MSAAFEFVAPIASAVWIDRDTAAVAKCSECRFVGTVYRIADQRGKRFEQREDKAYELATYEGWSHSEVCTG